MNVDEETLVEVVCKLEDYGNATNALTELKYINPARAGEIAFDVLENGKGDSHFQASAFETLYSANNASSLAYIDSNFKLVDLVVFRSMLECVAEDSPLVEGSPALRKAVENLVERASELSSEECEVLGDSLSWFRSSFVGF